MEIYAENNTDIHLIILDSNLCEKKRCDILEELRSFGDVPVIMLMENEEPEPQIVAYRMGADECVSSDVSFPLLKMKMEAILKRVYGTDNSIQEGILELDLDKRTLKVDNEYIDITIKEFELLSDHHGGLGYQLRGQRPGGGFSGEEVKTQAQRRLGLYSYGLRYGILF